MRYVRTYRRVNSRPWTDIVDGLTLGRLSALITVLQGRRHPTDPWTTHDLGSMNESCPGCSFATWLILHYEFGFATCVLNTHRRHRRIWRGHIRHVNLYNLLLCHLWRYHGGLEEHADSVKPSKA
jgi:hypothetical protein